MTNDLESDRPAPSGQPPELTFALPEARGALVWSIWIAVVAAGFLAQFIERARPMLHHR